MMKPFVRLMSVALVIVCLSASAEIVRWEFPRTGNCHEGIPFSDGRTGVLVWGGGETVNLTIGRSDLWDHRGGYPWTDEQNYTNIIEAVRTRDNARLQTLFRNDPPPGWGGRYNPYMLPLGRVVVTIPGVELVSGSLDPYTGLGTLSFRRARICAASCRWTDSVRRPPRCWSCLRTRRTVRSSSSRDVRTAGRRSPSRISACPTAVVSAVDG